MERFYHAVAIEEAELAKRKAQAEKRTGELAGLVGNASQKGEVRIRINSMETMEGGESPERRLSLRRRLSNSGVTGQIAWQAKRDRRRSSEGQTETPPTLSPRTSMLHDASSDPNITTGSNSAIKSSTVQNQPERLHRWDSKNMPLTIDMEEMKTTEEENPEEEPEEEKLEGEDGVRSVETSVESSEEESSDSEDLKLLKARILAQPIIDEEDTYHPRGKPVQHVVPEPPPVPAHRVPILDLSSDVPTRPVSLPSSPTNIMPKSILKKRTETEIIPLNQFGRPIPPEKPIRKMQLEELPQVQVPQQAPEPQTTVTLRKKSITSLPDPVKGAAISESDIDNSNVLSAAEIARSRRRQLRQASLEEEAEANMAVISHYTEIMREYSTPHVAHTPTYLKREDLARAAPVVEELEEPLASATEVKVMLKANGTGERGPRRGVETVAEKMNRELTERTKSPTPKREVIKDSRRSVDPEERPKLRRNSVTRGLTPSKEVKRESRPPSRNKSPGRKSRNVSRERRPSRPSSRNENRGVSQEKSLPRSRPPSRTASEDTRASRDKSLDKRKSSRPNSRSNSRDRFRSETPTQVKMERLQQALGSRKYRPTRQYSDSVAELTADAEKKVRSTMSYVTDLTLLAAAAYVYFLKSEILAVPFIGLLLYRQIQEEIHRRLPKWWNKRHTNDHKRH